MMLQAANRRRWPGCTETEIRFRADYRRCFPLPKFRWDGPAKGSWRRPNFPIGDHPPGSRKVLFSFRLKECAPLNKLTDANPSGVPLIHPQFATIAEPVRWASAGREVLSESWCTNLSLQ
jgi:hypothetical protein